MLDVNTLKAADFKGLSKSAIAELAAQMLVQMTSMSTQLQARDKQAAAHIREIKFKDAKLERITFELARLKAWKFGAKTERMNAEQRQMFDETAAEDEASLEAQLLALQGASEPSPPAAQTKRKPRRQPLPEQLRRALHRHEPESTTCPTPACGQAMVRIGEDVSERLDIVPAEFFVQRHVRAPVGTSAGANHAANACMGRSSSEPARARNSSTVITCAVENARIVSVALCTSAAFIAPHPTSG